MRSITKYGIAILLGGLLLTSCEQNILGPNKGTISGVVTDNNGAVVEGATITATYTIDEKTSSISGASDQTGYYILEDVPLTENELVAQATGFDANTRFVSLNQSRDAQTLNFTLVGAPEYVSNTQSHTKIYLTDTTQSDTVHFRIIMRDDFNTSTSSQYDLSVIFNSTVTGSISYIETATILSSSSSIYIFKATTEASSLGAGEFLVDVEISDPDGNSYTAEEIAEVEVLP